MEFDVFGWIQVEHMLLQEIELAMLGVDCAMLLVRGSVYIGDKWYIAIFGCVNWRWVGLFDCYYYFVLWQAGRSGLAVVHLAAVWENPYSNHTAGRVRSGFSTAN